MGHFCDITHLHPAGRVLHLPGQAGDEGGPGPQLGVLGEQAQEPIAARPTSELNHRYAALKEELNLRGAAPGLQHHVRNYQRHLVSWLVRSNLDAK